MAATWRSQPFCSRSLIWLMCLVIYQSGCSSMNCPGVPDVCSSHQPHCVPVYACGEGFAGISEVIWWKQCSVPDRWPVPEASSMGCIFLPIYLQPLAFWASWNMPVSLAHRRPRRVDCIKIHANLGYSETSSQKWNVRHMPFNPSTAEAGRYVSSRPDWSTHWVPGQSAIQKDPVSEKNQSNQPLKSQAY